MSNYEDWINKQDMQGVRTATDIVRKYNLNKIADIKDYTAEYGSTTIDGVTWTCEILKSGIVKMWCMVEVPYATTCILERQNIRFPFEFVEDAIGFVSLNEWGGGSEIAPKKERVLCRTNRCTVQVVNHLGGFAEDTTANVAVFVIGRLK